LVITTAEQLSQEKEDKLPSLYGLFLSKIAIIQDNINKGKRMFKFLGDDGRSSIKVHSLEERRSWTFQTHEGPGGGYNVEVSASRAADLTRPGPFSFGQDRWGVQVYHSQWDTFFNKNGNLGIGRRAEWEAQEWQWFPPEGMHDSYDVEGMEWEVGIGYRNLAKALEIVEKVIKGQPTVNDEEKLSESAKGKQKMEVEETKDPLLVDKTNCNSNKSSKKAKGKQKMKAAETKTSVFVGTDLTGAALDLVGLDSAPVDRTDLQGAALDLADLAL
jgi:hypothetical protein